MVEKNYGTIVVGQGIAGTCVAYQFLKAGEKVVVIDPEKENSASLVASGIINPITGRYFVKAWEFDMLWNYLLGFYREMEADLGLTIFERIKVFRALPSVKEFNDWMIRTGDPSIRSFLSEENDIKAFQSIVKLPEYSTAISGGRVNTANMIYGFRKLLKDAGVFLSEEFDFDQFRITEDKCKYKGITADRIVFCEGYKAANNPYFSDLPFRPYKGEVLLFFSTEKLPKNILKNDLFFVPLSEHMIWVGTKDSHSILSEEPEEKAVSELMMRAEKYLGKGFTFFEARAGVRPSVKDRRPLIGAHKDFRNMFIFNGLGSKGASLAPYFSGHLYNHITGNIPLRKDVNITRFQL